MKEQFLDIFSSELIAAEVVRFASQSKEFFTIELKTF